VWVSSPTQKARLDSGWNICCLLSVGESHVVLRLPMRSLLVSDVVSGPLGLSSYHSAVGPFSGGDFGEDPVVKSLVRVKSK
jgi:hypothetical protein